MEGLMANDPQSIEQHFDWCIEHVMRYVVLPTCYLSYICYSIYALMVMFEKTVSTGFIGWIILGSQLISLTLVTACSSMFPEIGGRKYSVTERFVYICMSIVGYLIILMSDDQSTYNRERVALAFIQIFATVCFVHIF